MIYTLEGSNHVSTFELVTYKLTLLADELVGHHRDNEEVPKRLALHEVADMTAVEEIEDPVGEDSSHL
jgi:hypothetical protein